MSRSRFPSLLCPSETVTEEQLATDRNILQFESQIPHLNRRGFLGSFAAAAAAATFAGARPAFGQTTTPAITDVLNFALNLEYLEANLYLAVTTGSGLSAADMGAGAVAPQNLPGKLSLDPATLAVAQALAQDERNHVELLRTTISNLGGTPIPQPLINYGAMGAITTQAQFIATARQFTAVGGSAYAGSAVLLISNGSVLTTASQILGAEGQHAGAINYLCINQGIVTPQVDAQDVPPSSTKYFTVDPTHALSPARTAAQALGVVYGVSTATTTTPPTGTTVGGFFPMGVNGNIKST